MDVFSAGLMLIMFIMGFGSGLLVVTQRNERAKHALWYVELQRLINILEDQGQDG